MSNRAQRRQQGKVKGRIMRQAKRRTKRQPRCPLCTNEITQGDLVKMDDGSRVHRSCAERLETARKMASAQRMEQSGFWLPGSE